MDQQEQLRLRQPRNRRQTDGWRPASTSGESPLMLLLLVIVVALSPMLLWLYLRDFAWGRETIAADRRKTDERHDYAQGYAQGVEDTNSYRRRAEEAEREVERLRAGRVPSLPAGE